MWTFQSNRPVSMITSMVLRSLSHKCRSGRSKMAKLCLTRSIRRELFQAIDTGFQQWASSLRSFAMAGTLGAAPPRKVLGRRMRNWHLTRHSQTLRFLTFPPVGYLLGTKITNHSLPVRCPTESLSTRRSPGPKSSNLWHLLIWIRSHSWWMSRMRARFLLRSPRNQ